MENNKMAISLRHRATQCLLTFTLLLGLTGCGMNNIPTLPVRLAKRAPYTRILRIS